MTPAANTLLPLIIVSLGILGVILSFLVPDRKKSVISLGLAVLIVVTGVFQLRGTVNFPLETGTRRLEAIQRDRQTDLEAIRKRLQDQAATPATPAKPGSAPATNKK